MLGMNDGAFPRTANPPSFDLISNPANPRRTGDSNKRDEDRYAFLTALIAAREQLLIFYTGQNQRDNSPLPPSILVADLLDTLDKYYAAGAVAGTAGKPSELLTITHPLHPFSRRYFTAGKDPRLVSYDAEAFAVAAAATGGGNYELDGSGAGAAGGVVAGAGAAGGAVSLNELANFLISPARTYYNSALGARLEVSEDTLPDDDGPLEPDALLTYSLCCEFLDFLEIHAPTAAAGTAAAGDEHAGTAGTKIFAPLIARLNAAGALPPAPKKLLDAAASCALALAGAVNALATGPRRPAFTRDLKLPAGTLQITFSEIRENGTQLFFRPSSSVKGKDRVRDTLWHLARCALGETTQTIRLAGNKKIEKLTYEPVASELAREHLNRLLVRYLAVTAGNPPPCFQPDAALIALETPPEGLNDALPKIRAAWNGRTEKGVQIGGADTYARRKFGSDPFEDTTGTPLADLLAIANETIAIAQPTFM
jgi:exodeoxyribonuclease V gamma subunit